MKILAVDTSSQVAAVAVLEDDRLLGEYSINHKKTHSQKLMPMISGLLEGLELAPADIDVFAASAGPGSFTGLRIGVAIIKAMAYATDKPVVGVPTLDALAYNLFPANGTLVCPIMDARNNQVYTAVYENAEGRQLKRTGYMGIAVSELAELLKEERRRVIFNGDAVALHRDILKDELGDMCAFAPGSALLQRAASVAQLALMRALRGEASSPFELVPFYLRKSQAERALEKRQSKADN